jgi:hypothetical protein
MSCGFHPLLLPCDLPLGVAGGTSGAYAWMRSLCALVHLDERY